MRKVNDASIRKINSKTFTTKNKNPKLGRETVVHVLFLEEPTSNMESSNLANHPVIKKILDDAYIPKSSSFRLLKEEIKKVVPKGFVTTGRSHLLKWQEKELAALPLGVFDGLGEETSGKA